MSDGEAGPPTPARPPASQRRPSVPSIVTRGLRSATDISGRDSLRQFWVYAGCITAATLVPTQVIVTAWVFPRMLQEREPGTTPFPEAFTLALVGIAVVLVLLLGAAVCRRLHDTDRRGVWGLLPLPFLPFGVIGTQRTTSQSWSDDGLDLSTFGLLLANNVAYLAALATLVWMLVGAGTDGPNRYGEPDEPLHAPD